MIAYRGRHELKREVIAEMAKHRKADALVQGYGYWKDGKGCAVAAADAAVYAAYAGKQQWQRTEDKLIEILEANDAARTRRQDGTI